MEETVSPKVDSESYKDISEKLSSLTKYSILLLFGEDGAMYWLFPVIGILRHYL